MRARRRPFDDELVLDGELVVLLDGTVVMLSEVASAAPLRARSNSMGTNPHAGGAAFRAPDHLDRLRHLAPTS